MTVGRRNSYNVDDRVLLCQQRSPKKSASKFRRIWQGPYEVIFVRSTFYLIREADRRNWKSTYCNWETGTRLIRSNHRVIAVCREKRQKRSLLWSVIQKCVDKKKKFNTAPVSWMSTVRSGLVVSTLMAVVTCWSPRKYTCGCMRLHIYVFICTVYRLGNGYRLDTRAPENFKMVKNWYE